MTSSGSLASIRSVEAAASGNHRLAVALLLTGFNSTVIGSFAGTIYRATANNALQQAGVTLLFAALLGSLARVWLLALRSRTR